VLRYGTNVIVGVNKNKRKEELEETNIRIARKRSMDEDKDHGIPDQEGT